MNILDTFLLTPPQRAAAISPRDLAVSAGAGSGKTNTLTARFVHLVEQSETPRRVVAVTGDGGFMMNSQELETAVRLKLPLVILIWRDNGYGVIRWKQQVRFGRTSSVDFGNPDFVRYAESFGAAGYRVTAPTELRPILEQALQLDVPAVIDCPVDDGENLRLTKRLQALPVLQ